MSVCLSVCAFIREAWPSTTLAATLSLFINFVRWLVGVGAGEQKRPPTPMHVPGALGRGRGRMECHPGPQIWA